MTGSRLGTLRTATRGEAINVLYGDGSRRRRILTGLLLVVLGGLAFSSTGSIEGVGGTTHALDSSFTPRVVTGLLVLFGIIIAVTKPPTQTEEEAVDISPDRWRLGLSVLAVALYVFLVEPLGFVLSSALYIAIQALVLSPRGKKQRIWALVVALALPIPVYVAFVRGMNILLPVGAFG